MTKPIDSPKFWHERIALAMKSGELRDSVYVTTPQNWEVVDKQHLKIIRKYMSPKSVKVLDAGCGFGRFCQHFSPYVYTHVSDQLVPDKVITYVGVDKQEKFIELAKRRHPKYQFTVADLTNLPFNDKVFDWAIGISLQAMVASNLGWDKWKEIQDELLRVSKEGVLCLEYGNQTEEGALEHVVIRSW